MISKDEFDRWFQQIWNIPGASTKQHPAPFPLELAIRLVRMFSFTGDTVLDPFCGTGTTMIAALRTGRNSVGVELELFQADLNTYRLVDQFDVIFSTGVLHSTDPAARDDILENYQLHTREGGIHVLSVFVAKPFIAPAPDRDPSSSPWKSGDLLRYYADWRIEWCTEEIFTACPVAFHISMQ